MARLEISTKRIAISRAEAQMVIIVGVAAFVTVFSLVAAKAVWSQTRYQARVTSVSEKAHKQLQTNLSNYSNLVTSFNSFESTSTNVIGGNPAGSGQNDGDNATVIIHALPDKYDFPALTSTLEKILKGGGYGVSSITGTDDQLNQQKNISSPTPKPVSMPFSFTISNTNYGAIQQLVSTLQASIRPIQIDSLTISGGASNMTLTVNAHTYYQPGKTVNITQQVVK
jgi:hypothetical protein